MATDSDTLAGGKLMVGQEDVLLILYLRAGLASIRFQNTQFRVPLSEVQSNEELRAHVLGRFLAPCCHKQVLREGGYRRTADLGIPN